MTSKPASRAGRLAAASAALALAAGCGSDDEKRANLPEPRVTIEEAQRLLEKRTAARVVDGGSPLEPRIDPRPVGSVRMRVAGAPPFDVLAFASPAALRRAWPSVQDLGPVYAGARTTPAVNLLAVFPRRAPTGAFDEVRGVLRHLDDVCGPTVEVDDRVSDLRTVCAAGAEALPGPVDQEPREEPAVPGEAVRLGGIAYSVAMTRQLNPYTSPDETFVGGRKPDDGETFLGVFLRACNEDGERRAPTSQLRLASAFGREVAPVDLPAANAYAYTPRPLEEDRCIPADGTVAARVNDGALVLFEVPYEMLDERPLVLRITGDDGRDRGVRLDL